MVVEQRIFMMMGMHAVTDSMVFMGENIHGATHQKDMVAGNIVIS